MIVAVPRALRSHSSRITPLLEATSESPAKARTARGSEQTKAMATVVSPAP